MTYRVALIGAGNWGACHARQWTRLPEAEIVGVLDPRTEAAAALGTAYSDWEALLASAKPDIIDICTPTPQHREYVERAAAAGRAIFVEAPLGRTQEDCDAMVAAVERAGVPAMVGHAGRFAPEYAAAGKMVRSGAVGTPAAIRTARMSGVPAGSGDWYADFAQSGGVVLDTMVHDFDWLREAFGPATRVFAQGTAGRAKAAGRTDYALVTLRFESGAVGHVTGSWAHGGASRTTLEVAGDGGLIEFDSARSVPLIASSPSAGSILTESPSAPEDDPVYSALSAFIQSLQENAPPPVTLTDGAEAVRIALAALESMAIGKAILL